MSQPVDPYRDDPRRATPQQPRGRQPYEPPYGNEPRGGDRGSDPYGNDPYSSDSYGSDPYGGGPHGGQPQGGGSYGGRPYGGQPPRQPYGRQPQGGQPQQPYGQDPYGQRPYEAQPYGDQSYGDRSYGGGQQYAAPGGRRSQAGYEPLDERQPAAGRHASGRRHGRAAAPAPPSAGRRPRRVPGLGLVFALLGLVVQLVSFTALSWVRVGAGQPGSPTPKVWELISDHGAHGFGGWYVVAFSYPLAVLSIVLALASVFESVALKVIWAGLTVIGLGVLLLRYGFGPFATEGPHLRTWQIVLVAAAVGVLVIVIFVLRSAVAMFRRTAGLIMLALAGVHIAAVYDLVRESGIEHLDLGAYGPALGYLLTAIAAFTGPRRVPGA